MKVKFLKDGEAQIYQLWVKMSKVQAGGSCRNILKCYYSNFYFYFFFSLHSLLVSVGAGALSWLAGLIQSYL